MRVTHVGHWMDVCDARWGTLDGCALVVLDGCVCGALDE